jgi:hypothetical protein
MAAWEDTLADAIATELNDPARPWFALFTTENTVATRTRAPWYTATQLKTLQVAAIPLSLARTRVARSRREFNYDIPIDLQRMVGPTDDVTLRAFSKLAERIHDFFDDGHQLVGVPGWVCLKAERPHVYSLPQLHARGVWETLISVDVRGYR